MANLVVDEEGVVTLSRWRLAKTWPFILGFAFILFAIALEHPSLLGHLPVAADEAGKESAIFSGKTIILWIAEIGYAFVIAGVVSAFLEATARQEQNDQLRKDRSKISQDVVEAIFKIKHNENYVRAVIGTCFESPIIREDYVVEYTVDYLSKALCRKLGVEYGRFADVEASIRYTVRNVSAEKGTFPTAYGIPVRAGALRDLAKMTMLKIGDDNNTQADIDKLEQPSKGLDGDSERTYSFDVILSPLETTQVALKVRLIKELSDSDAFGFRRPTLGATIRIMDNTKKLIFGMTSRTSASWEIIQQPKAGKTGEWKINGPILPFDSCVLWWRTEEDSGTANPTPAPES